MQRAGLLFRPIIGAPFAIIKAPYSHLSHPRLPCAVLRNHRPLKTWMTAFNPKVQVSLPNSCWNIIARKVQVSLPNSCWNIIARKFHHHIHNLSFSGSRFTIGGIFGLPVLTGSISCEPHIGYSTDGFEFVVDDDQMNSMDGSDSEKDLLALLTFVKKLLLPIFLFLTVLTNWGHPIIIAAKVTAILFSTKPSPFSVYLFIEQLRHQAMRQHPFLYKFKPFHAKRVEVEDYVVLCLARVELEDLRYTLLGILGNWWVLPRSSWREAFFTLTNRALHT